MNPVILLHGALGSSQLWEPLIPLINSHWEVHTLDFSGHGGQSFNEKGFGIPVFAEEVVQYLDQKQLEKADIFGYSMGGYVGLYVAMHHKNRIGKITTMGTKFDWNPDAAEKESAFLKPEIMEQKIPDFVGVLKKRHHPNDWKSLVSNTATMINDLGQKPLLTKEDLSKIKNEVVIGWGEKDRMVSREESEMAASALPNGRVTILQNTPHPLEGCDPHKLFSLLIH